MKKLLLLACVFIFASFKNATPAHVQDYINTHSKYAVQLMKSKNIPASITLAQGMLESGFGRSYLAKEHFNFFGVMDFKEDYWPDDCTYHAKSGRVWRSYADYSEAYKDRGDFFYKTAFYDGFRPYERLLKTPNWNYKHWAIGLQKAGYAGRDKASKSYAKTLIRIIEKYNLQRFDK